MIIAFCIFESERLPSKFRPLVISKKLFKKVFEKELRFKYKLIVLVKREKKMTIPKTLIKVVKVLEIEVFKTCIKGRGFIKIV